MENFLELFGMKGGGIIPILFLMGVFMNWQKIADPMGIVFMIAAGVLAVIYVIIELIIKTKKSKWDFW